MRTIPLYRALRINPSEEDLKESNGWCYGGITSPNHHPEGKIQIVSCEDHEDGSKLCFIDVKPETVGQNTGLKDKNGKEIFEGDIFLFGGLIQNTVIFQRGMFCYNPNSDGDNLYDIVPLSNHNFCWVSGRSERIQVIGNIHDTPYGE